MLKKEPLTKKQCIKLVKSRIRSIWVSLIAILVFLILGLVFIHISILIKSTSALIFFLIVFLLIPITSAVFFIRNNIIDAIKLYSGRFYLVEAPLISKRQVEHYKPSRFQPDYYIEYLFYFDTYGNYSIRSYDLLYDWSEENKMEPRMADIITEHGDEFYLLVRGGKKKKIVAIFHKKLFELQEYEFTQMCGKYYL